MKIIRLESNGQESIVQLARNREFVSLGRDPFARLDYVRRRAGEGQCGWCGQGRRLWNYGVWHDGGRTDWDDGSFCSKGCYRSFHG